MYLSGSAAMAYMVVVNVCRAVSTEVVAVSVAKCCVLP